MAYPAIQISDEAFDTWARFMNRISGFGVDVTLVNGEMVEGILEYNYKDHLTVRLVEPISWEETGESKIIDVEDVDSILVH